MLDSSGPRSFVPVPFPGRPLPLKPGSTAGAGFLSVVKTPPPAYIETVTLVEKIRRALAPCRPEQVFLFGSAARGEADAWSDVDLIVVLRTDLPFVERPRLAAPALRKALGRSVDILVYTPEEFEEMKNRNVGVVARALEEGVRVV